ncbi:MAG: peptidylprolyl isomerase [Nitrospinae bacterium]|nr:peptidylprolyl isomerase [Nitrospinota bacterium]
MKRFIPFIFLFCLVATHPSSSVWAHSGHKHNELTIKLPKIVAKVNDHDISGDVIVRELKKAAAQYKKRGIPLTADQEKSAAKSLIDDEIGRTLLVLKAKESGITVSEKMLSAKLEEVKAKFKSDSIFEHRLADRGMTVDQYKQELEIDMFMDQFIKKEIEPNIKIAEKDARNYYDNNKRKFESEEKVRASIMLLNFNPKQGKSGEQAVLKKFESILDQLKNGSDFGALAKQHSQDSLASKGGDLGYFTRKQMLPAFSTRAFKMKVGEVSDIFRTGHGFHVLKVTDKKSGGLSPFETEKAKIEKFLANKKVSQATRDYIENLKKKAKIKTYY